MTLQEAFELGYNFQNLTFLKIPINSEMIANINQVIESTDKRFKEAFKIGQYKCKLDKNIELTEIQIDELVSLCFKCRVLTDTTDILNYIIANYPSIIKKQKLIKNISGHVNSLNDYLETNNNNFENTKETIQEYIDELQKILNEFN
jgi:hypothetical protein